MCNLAERARVHASCRTADLRHDLNASHPVAEEGFETKHTLIAEGGSLYRGPVLHRYQQ
jgi:hypothetical protein